MEKAEKTSLWKKLRNSLTDDEIFHEAEVQANKLGSLMLLCCGIVLAIIILLTVLDVFPLSGILSPSIQAMVEIAVLLIISRIVKYDKWWLKHLLILGLIIVFARLDSMLTHKAAMLMIFPVVFSSRYFSRKLTVITSIITTVCFFLSAIWGATHGMINVNIVTMEKGTQMIATGGFLGDTIKNAGVTDEMLIKNTLLYDYLPKWLMFSIISVISCNIAMRGRNMVTAQHEKDAKTARIESELSLATNIQASMLPSTFPAFPDKKPFDIFALMDPAKEVGGDFYDFFMTDDDHLCIVMADVSGKGVPAALFMMASKIIIANNAKMGKSPAQVLTDTNAAICANNREEMFVTVWLGLLEISTGKLTCANAGHEYPIVQNENGEFELYKDKHGFVIGGMEGMKYKEYEIMLKPGMKLFLYTDGVPEAANSDNVLFGMERTLSALNSDMGASPKDVLGNVRHEVDVFTGDADQFDDLTMLCLEYRGINN